MNRPQKILIIAGSLLVAGFLLVKLCDWTYRESSSWGRVIASYPHASPPAAAVERRRPGRSRGMLHTGLLAQRSVERSTAIIAGVVVPLTLVALTAYILLGWREDGRRRVNRCPKCGYDLRGTKSPHLGRCPECGTMSILSHPHLPAVA